jgi:hypothetical protein
MGSSKTCGAIKISKMDQIPKTCGAAKISINISTAQKGKKNSFLRPKLKT